MEKQPQEYRVILRRDFHAETDDPFIDGITEPEPDDVMWTGSMADPNASELWEEAGLVKPIPVDKYEIQIRNEDGGWQFMGFFSTPDDLQWVIETVRGDALAD